MNYTVRLACAVKEWAVSLNLTRIPEDIDL